MTSTVLPLPQGTDALARPFRLRSLKPLTAVAPEAPARRISSQSLLEGGRELVIQHQGQDDGAGQQDVERGPHEIGPEVADALAAVGDEAARQGRGDGRASRGGNEVLHRQSRHQECR